MDPNISTQPAQPNLQQQMQSPVKNNSKKMFWIFFIISFLIAFTAGGYFLGTKQNNSSQQKVVTQSTPTPTTDPTANWKTYANAQYGFAIKYPSDFTLKDTMQKTNIRAVASQNLTISGDALPGAPSFTIWVNPDGFGLEGTNILYKFGLTKQGEIGVSDRQIVPENEMNGGPRTIIQGNTADLLPNKFFFWFVFKKGVKDYESLFRQILSTFKFTDQNQATDPTASWKTYSNAQYGIEFKYPPITKIDQKYTGLSSNAWVYPPAVKNVSNSLSWSCTDEGQSGAGLRYQRQQNMGGNNYCILEEYNSASGTTQYSTSYTSNKGTKQVTLQIKYTLYDCSRLDVSSGGSVSAAQDCISQQKNFTDSLPGIMDQIFSTLKFTN